MFIVVSTFFIRYFTPKNISAVTVFPFIIVEKKEIKADKILLNHEMIHIHQQAELFLIFFFLLYYTEFFVLYLKYKDIHLAYRNISFEREAYANEANYSYLKTRKWLSFIKYW